MPEDVVQAVRENQDKIQEAINDYRKLRVDNARKEEEAVEEVRRLVREQEAVMEIAHFESQIS